MENEKDPKVITGEDVKEAWSRGVKNAPMAVLSILAFSVIFIVLIAIMLAIISEL